MIKSKLQAIEPGLDGLSKREVAILLELQAAGVEIDVLSVEVSRNDGNPVHDYYNVRLPSGLMISGLAGVHLADIDRWQRPKKFAHQFVVELTSEHELGPNAMATTSAEYMIKRVLAGSLLAQQRVYEVTLVKYETSYPVEGK